ncbi:hypothetical protein [Photobacterium leiognathi]|uniref:hypothetical protein n=1 Tax=Photobacterium leiognathi TaxID=553611 RepID=UPI00298113F0|nr:hypothetical protein [Photobacterium leiognathi]
MSTSPHKQNSFILNIDRAEFDVDFITNAGDREFWHRDARASIIEKLKTAASEASHYAQFRQENQYQKTRLGHNSILLHGGRGTGKTVFLRNLDTMWQHSPSVGNKKSLQFLGLIDPTMLIKQDSFSNVVISEIFRLVTEVLKTNAGQGSRKLSDQFYQKAKLLSESIGIQDEFNGNNGVDKIIEYRSCIQLEERFHAYAEAALKVLKCQALVVRIDDVDMALSRAFDVIDDIRRLLGCPYIIPVVSGDLELYSQMIGVKLDEEAYQKNSAYELKKQGKRIASHLTDAYLTKIFPANLRQRMVGIESVTHNLMLKEANEDQGLFYQHLDNYQKKFRSFLNQQANNQPFTEVENARELVQFAKSFSVMALNGAVSDNQLWENYQAWCEQKKLGSGFIHARSYFDAKNALSSHRLMLNSLPAFNPMKQTQQEYPWAEKLFEISQKDSLDVLKDINNTTLFENAFFNGMKTVNSQPPIELISSKFMVPKVVSYEEELEAKMDSDVFLKAKHIFNIYTHSTYYSTQFNSAPIVFVGKAFEIIALSFLYPNPVPKEVLFTLLQRAPLHSILSFSTTKTINRIGKEPFDSSFDDESNYEANINATVNYLYSEIARWQQHIRGYNLETLELIPLFEVLFNQVFTQISLLKQKMNTGYGEEHLSDFARRFEHIMMNSAYIQISRQSVVLANTSVTSNYDTLRNFTQFRSSDRTLMRNKAMFDEYNQAFPKVLEKETKFLSALWEHPIFMLNHSCSDEYLVPLYKLSTTDVIHKFQTAEQRSKRAMKESSELKNIIDDFRRHVNESLMESGLNTLTKSKCLDWLNDSRNESKAENFAREFEQKYDNNQALLNQLNGQQQLAAKALIEWER